MINKIEKSHFAHFPVLSLSLLELIMNVRFLGALLGVIYATGAAAQESKNTPLAEVRLTDGSLLRMMSLQENLEVQTKFGKLTIPDAQVGGKNRSM